MGSYCGRHGASQIGLIKEGNRIGKRCRSGRIDFGGKRAAEQFTILLGTKTSINVKAFFGLPPTKSLNLCSRGLRRKEGSGSARICVHCAMSSS